MQQSNSNLTPESVLATLDLAFKKSVAEFDQKLEKSRAEAAERAAEADRRAAEADRRAAERAAENKQFDAEFKLKMQELREERAETAKFLKQLGQQIGGVSNSNGDMAEEFFFNALYNGQRKMFGEEFGDVVKDIRVGFKGNEDQYDIVMINGRSICVVEVKYKADSEDLPRKTLRKAQTFRANFPQHRNKKVFLAIAVMSINPLTEQACINAGIAIIKQLGDTITVHDENLRTF